MPLDRTHAVFVASGVVNLTNFRCTSHFIERLENRFL